MNFRNTASCLLASCFLCVVISLVLTTAEAQTVRVDVTPEHVANSFRPTEALGAGVDRIPLKATDKIFTEPVLKQILSAGWQTITYRQNTELYVEAWHWNPKGTWSEPGNKGYFVGDSTPTEFIRHSFGYPLPHAGFSHPDGTSYSRLTDGDLNTYWKSNPYLTKAYTGEEDTLHPQWVVVDMQGVQDINAIRINWADPYAKRYLVQYWTGTDPIEEAAKGSWVTFPGGEINTGKGGNATLQLSQTPLPARFVRIWMTESSGTCDTHGSADRRNCLGYGIRELFLGTTTPDGRLHDVLRHTADRGQTTTICSSVDPWHEVSLVNEHGDQVGFDLFFTSGITRGLPTMIPVAMLYDTPENAVAEITYLEKRGYPISYVEMGEEPDGKHTLPEDYAALYLQWATALHRVDPIFRLCRSNIIPSLPARCIGATSTTKQVWSPIFFKCGEMTACHPVFPCLLRNPISRRDPMNRLSTYSLRSGGRIMLVLFCRLAEMRSTTFTIFRSGFLRVAKGHRLVPSACLPPTQTIKSCSQHPSIFQAR